MKTHFFAGGQNSGSPVHFHALAVNVVAWGRKEWWVAPVRKSFYTNEPAAVRRARIAAQAIESGMPTSSSSEFTHFVQNALDIVVGKFSCCRVALETGQRRCIINFDVQICCFSFCAGAR